MSLDIEKKTLEKMRKVQSSSDGVKKLDNNKLLEKLTSALEQSLEPNEANASVVVLLRVENQVIQVLLVKRAVHPTDTWSGQIALPGGKKELNDKSLKETVVRETLEETRINLLEDCQFLGLIEPLRSAKRPEMKILPFVVLQKEPQTINLNNELTEYFWAPLKELNKHKKEVKLDFGELTAYTVDGHIIWGLTFNILHNLLSLLEAIDKE
jgi:8-oxo-dGTP pyrophosphatase MutT (NUDIX family)